MQTTTMPTLVSATTAAAAAKSGGVVFGGGPLVKDSRWLTLEVCREFARNKCTRLDDECRFAHPPSNVEIQNGRVMCCFDSIKGRCQRSDPPCKYLHPPQHLKEQLLQNGRNNLIWRNFQMQQQLSTGLHQFVPTMLPMVQGPSAPLPAPSASYVISANAPAAAATYYHSPVSSTTTTIQSPMASMATMAVMASMVLQPTTHNTDQSEVSSTDDVTLSSASCLANGGCGGGGGVSQNQYWMNPAVLDSSLSSANYYSPVFYQGLNQIVPVAKTHLIPADLRHNGNVAVFPCGGSPSSYQQVTLSSASVTGGQQQQQQQQPTSCYRLTVPGTLPVMQRY